MKNLFLFPTDKPSRVLYNSTLKSFCIQKEINGMFINDGKVSGADFWGLEKALNNGFKPHNIYITSDEEIKDGDWFMDITFNNYGKVYKSAGVSKSLGYENWIKSTTNIVKEPITQCKKIILTTDQDLINDGVQSIDDEFLEWFVKNPSCEFVQTDKILQTRHGVNWYDLPNQKTGNEVDGIYRFYYKIIIPKEEPKQICDNCKIEISKYGCACGGKPKQETLEEVGMYQQELFNYLHDLGVTALQSEMQEIERIVLGMQNINALHFEIDALKREIKVFKHQQEQDKNKFSEEDLISLLEFNYKKETNQLGTLRKDYSQKIVREWFKQFKNK